MEEPNYGITKALPTKDLLRVPHQRRVLTVAYPAFGPDSYRENLLRMQRRYFHSSELPDISFDESTTAESISIAAYDITRTKEEILDSRGLQLGPIVQAPEWIVANPPKDEQGNLIIDKRALRKYLAKSKRSRDIWIYQCPNTEDLVFVPYETFKQEVQEVSDFVEGGLARALENTSGKKAEKLAAIILSEPSLGSYKLGIYVGGFDEVTEPVLRVASLYSRRYICDRELLVTSLICGDDLDHDGGYVFGKLIELLPSGPLW